MPTCDICGEYRFTGPAQASCHATMNHATFSCGCGHKFLTEKSLQEHKHTMKENLKAKPCTDCCRSFDTQGSLSQHKRDKGHSPPSESNRCPCGKLCKSSQGLAQHIRDKQTKLGIKESDIKSKEEYFDKFYKDKVMVRKDDRKESVKTQRDVLGKIMDHVRKQDGGDIYGPEIRKAGSHATRTKVMKADEFDTNIPLKIEVPDQGVTTRGTVKYIYKDKLEQRDPKKASPRNLNVSRDLVPLPKGRQHHIPMGHASVKVTEETHGRLTHSGDLIPRKVQEDLHQRMKSAIKDMDLKNVYISRDAHGPALTLTIAGRIGKHDINVDVTASVDNRHVPVGVYGWPRPDTRKMLSPETIGRVEKAGTHLVPKGEEFWSVSHSRAETELMKGIDKGNQCRRQCYKMLKADFKTWQSQSPDGYPGVSSHMMKHALFWMNERHQGGDPGYWNHGNIHQCYTDYLKAVKQHLDKSKLPNYFNPMENLIGKKDKEVLHRLSGRVQQRRDELQHMKP